MRAVIFPLGATLLLAGCFLGTTPSIPEPTNVSAISVRTDLQSVGNAVSVSYWQTLSRDLEAALVTEFTGHVEPAGAVLVVDVDEITLADSNSAGVAGENARLTGVVTLSDPGSGSDLGSYEITATASDAAAPQIGTGAAGGAPDSGAFYAALVESFAQGVAQAVLQGPQGAPLVVAAQP